MIVIGAKYKDDCPVEHKIPIWLIVSGVVALFQGLFAPAFRNDGKSERTSGRGIFQAVGLIINIFQMVWLIIGSVWVYGNYEPSYNEADGDMFCNETVYLFSFWILNVTYIGLCIALFVSIGVSLYNRGLSGNSSY
ncbi:Hypothetical predicted protein [Paramuricea clavata]|uniref:Uncharacterized protein n=1 Tax=Paramuricea clavata TaxID=317549 RepID=A0A7D9DF12_PARCT|nr:Hypothetical predicted protein [Paramuricea clavata]